MQHCNDFIVSFMERYHYPEIAVKEFTRIEKRLDAEKDFGDRFDAILNGYMFPEADGLGQALDEVKKLGEEYGENEYTIQFMLILNCMPILKERYDADEQTLVKLVCKSIDGAKWYRRLRGIEVDDCLSDIKSVGRQYVMESSKLSREETRARILHLSEDVGYRLRSKNLYARGVYVWLYGYDDIYYHKSTILKTAINILFNSIFFRLKFIIKL